MTTLIKYRFILILILYTVPKALFSEQLTEQIDNRHSSSFAYKSKPSVLYQGSQSLDNQIGNSYFAEESKTVSQLGIATEEHQQFANLFIFLNQYFKNHIFYELRLYGIYHYLTQNPPELSLVSKEILVSDERHPLGYGYAGILAYNFDINSNVSFMPFIRGQGIKNTGIAYKDIYGNQINSTNFIALGGGKLSMRVNTVFAVYAQMYFGYGKSILVGRGVFFSTEHPTINFFQTVIEFGSPYKITEKWSLTPYIQLITINPHPNRAALNSPYDVNSLVMRDNVYAIKLGYAF